MKKLSRKHARMVIGFMAAAIFFAVVSMLIMETYPTTGAFAFLAFFGFAGMALYCRFHFLRCPVCRKGVAVANWNPTPGKHKKCPVCKCDFIFDDEINIKINNGKIRR